MFGRLFMYYFRCFHLSDACRHPALWCPRHSGVGCVSAGCLHQLCVALAVSTQMVWHASTHGRFIAWGSHHLLSSIPPSIFLFFSPSTSVTLCFFLSPAPAAPVSTGLLCCLSDCVRLFLCECVVSRCWRSALRTRLWRAKWIISVYHNLDFTFPMEASMCYNHCSN